MEEYLLATVDESGRIHVSSTDNIVTEQDATYVRGEFLSKRKRRKTTYVIQAVLRRKVQ